jgi:hypothetical protein
VSENFVSYGYFDLRFVIKREKVQESLSALSLSFSVFLCLAQTLKVVMKARLIYTDNHIIKWKDGLG